MPTVCTKIIDGELPGRFGWRALDEAADTGRAALRDVGAAHVAE